MLKRSFLMLAIYMMGMMVTLGQDTTPEANVRLLVEGDSFTVYISATVPTSVSGLSFRVVYGEGLFQTYSLTEGFSILNLTEGLAPPGSCFIYALDGAEPPLASICATPDLVFRRYVPRSDVFWYDFTANRQRDIAIVSYDEITGEICPAALADCRITYIDPLQAESISALPTTPSIIATVPANPEWTPVVRTFGGVDMVLVPAGCFMMGSDNGDADERPVHEQCFDTPFWIDRYEVTNLEYGSSGRFSGDRYPRESITWFEAQDHCELRGGRLPTEVEWEYAGRGPDNLIYPWGNVYDADKAVVGTNSDGRTAEVGSKSDGVSWVGAYDLSGNVYEWVSSVHESYPYEYSSHETEGETTSYRVMRGGSWKCPTNNVCSYNTRLGFRSWDRATALFDFTGFRCARDFQPGDV